MEATGSLVVSDGEQRASSFATYPLTDTLAGTGLADYRMDCLKAAGTPWAHAEQCALGFISFSTLCCRS